MKLVRIFSGQAYKGTRGYLKTQRVYEIIRTVLLFSISGALFLGGYLGTGTRLNLLTIVAVLGILPASKSLVSVIMHCRYSGLSEENAEKIAPHAKGLTGLYDMVFTGNEKNFEIGHLTVKDNMICGFCEQKAFDEKAFQKHLGDLLKADQHKNVSMKIFTDVSKYVDRLDQLKDLPNEGANTAGIVDTLKSISL